MATMSGQTNMSKQKMGEYLDELRNHRPSRPSLNGTRSPPPSTRRRSWRSSIHSITSPSFDESSYKPGRTSRSSSRLSFNENGESIRSGLDSLEKYERSAGHDRRDISRDREESRRVSRALEQLDSQDEEAIMAAAKAEAEELMWRYNNDGAPYRPPIDMPEKKETTQEEFKKPLPRRSLDLLRKLSFTKESPRSERPGSSSSAAEQELKPRRSFRRLSQKLSFSKMSRQRRTSNSKRNISGEIQTESFPNEKQKIYEDAPEDVADLVSTYAEEESERQPLHVRRNPFARARQSVSMSPNKMKAKKSFMERVETKENPIPQRQNPSHVSVMQQSEPTSQTVDISEETLDFYEPVEYRNGKEVRSDDIRAATSMRKKDRSSQLPSPSAVTDRPDRPIVSFDPDWKPPETTKDVDEMPANPGQRDQSVQNDFASGHRSISAPTTRLLNSNSRTRIASKPAGAPEIKARPSLDSSKSEHDPPYNGTEHRRSNRSTAFNAKSASILEQAATNGTTRHALHSTRDPQTRPVKSERTSSETKSDGVRNGTPMIPTISCTPAADDVQSESHIHHHKHATTQSPIPMISCTPAEENSHIPNPQGRSSRRPGMHSHPMSQPHWTPGPRDRLALCSQCALSIAGRSVSAAGALFHPECFTCHHCREALECVAFYPEPAEHRAARVERNELRAMGEIVEQPEGTSEEDDADDSLRFFCHLDFHEFFSPRCKTCKTPIEGQVIVACGAEYHPGHFFCAQCGDPFNPSTPFVEKDGYAWCVNCHTNRYSAKCRKCHRPITKMVLNALGTEWHEECFRCMECDGKFTDGRYFLRGDDKAPVCFACEERRLKA